MTKEEKEHEKAIACKEKDLQAREDALKAKEKAEIAKEAKEAEEVKVATVVKSKQEAEDAEDKARKARVDAQNKTKFAQKKAKEAEMASVPLNNEEKSFIARIAPQMNNGRNQPPPADIQRYSRLIKRKNVKC